MNFEKVNVIDKAFPFIVHEDFKEIKYHILYNFTTPTTIFSEIELPEPFIITKTQKNQYVRIF